MDLDVLFRIGNLLALGCWIALILYPDRSHVAFAVRHGALALFGLAYAILIAVFFFRVEGGGFFSLPAVQILFTVPEVAWAGWLHYLAFDLFVGVWIAERLDALGVSRLAQAPILVATFMFGPFGYLLYLACAWTIAARAKAAP